MKRLSACTAILGVAAGLAAHAEAVAPDSIEIVDGAVEQSLTGVPGDPANGRKVYLNRGLGNCLACHANTDMKAELFHGDVGPAMDGVASRYEPGQLRAILMNSKAVFGDTTIMPGFYTLKVGFLPEERFVGKTILSAQEVEDVVAYLGTLKQ
jgi:sulfur-oxidizing protein SoxX